MTEHRKPPADVVSDLKTTNQMPDCVRDRVEKKLHGVIIFPFEEFAVHFTRNMTSILFSCCLAEQRVLWTTQ